MKRLQIQPNKKNIWLYVISIIPVFTLVTSSNSFFAKLILILTLIILVFLYFSNSKGTIKKNELLMLLINVLSILITSSTYSALGSTITYFNTIFCFILLNNIEVEKKQYCIIHGILGITISCYVFSIPKPTYIGNRIMDSFHNLINTNMISILFLCAYLHIMCVLLQFKKNKILITIEILLSLVYGGNIWFYGARSAIASMFLFIISIIFVKKSIPYNIYKKIVLIILSLSLLFPFLYLAIVKNMDILEFLGKGIGSRRIVWENCVDVIEAHPLFGVGNDVSIQMRSTGELTTSMHNTLLGLWKILGVVPLITFLFYCTYNCNSIYDNQKMLVSQLAFISTLLICFFESFYTEELLYLAFLPFLICNVKAEE